MLDMHCYLPFYLYEDLQKTKYITEYNKLVEDIDLHIASLPNLSSRIMDNEELAKKYAKVRDFVYKLFPDHRLSLDIIWGGITESGLTDKTKCLEIYKTLSTDNVRDVMIATACLQQIIDLSYEDGTYIDYMKQFVKDFGQLKPEIQQQLPTYYHEGRLRVEVFMLCEEIKDSDPENWLSICSRFMDSYNSTFVSKIVDSDTINQQFVESACDLLTAAYNSKYFNEYAQYFYNAVLRTSYQYDQYSYGRIRFLFIIAQYHLIVKNYTEFVNTFYELVQYINHAFEDITNFIKGICYFDTINVLGTLAICRWCIKIAQKCPFMTNSLEKPGLIKDIPIADYELAMMDVAEIEKTVNLLDIHPFVDIRFIKTIDKAFAEDGYATINLKALERIE